MLRLVVSGQDYAQIENYWTIGMVLEANEALDIQQEAERKAMKSKEG